MEHERLDTRDVLNIARSKFSEGESLESLLLLQESIPESKDAEVVSEYLRQLSEVGSYKDVKDNVQALSSLDLGPDGHWYAGFAALSSKNYEDALEELSKVSSSSSCYYNAKYHQCDILDWMGNPDMAEQVLDSLPATLNSLAVKALYECATNDRHGNLTGAALALVSQAYPPELYSLAEVWRHRLKLREAQIQLLYSADSSHTGPSFPSARLRVAFDTAEQPDHIVPEIEKAFRADPVNAKLARMLYKTYRSRQSFWKLWGLVLRWYAATFRLRRGMKRMSRRLLYLGT